MKKLLYIITIPDWGGAQRYVFDLAENLKSEFEITVAFGQEEKNDALKNKCIPAKIKIHQFENLIRPINLKKDRTAISEIAEYIDAEKPDIIHLNSSKAGVLSSLAIKKTKHKSKIIYTVHGWVFLEPMNILKKWLYIFLEKIASRHRNKIILLGEREKQITINHKICKTDKLVVINHAIPEINFLTKKDALIDLKIPQDKIIAGTIANDFPSKGLKYFKKAANLLNNSNIELVNIGELLQTSYTLTNAARYLKVLDIFILPSIKEGAPYVILEAMAAGLPIVATDVGNVVEMLQNYPNKTIVPPANPEALAKAIVEIKPRYTEHKSDFTGYIEKMKKLYNDL